MGLYKYVAVTGVRVCVLSKAGLSTWGWERTGCAGIILLYIHLLGVYITTRGQLPLTNKGTRRSSGQKAGVCVSVWEECLPRVLITLASGKSACEDEGTSVGLLEISVGRYGCVGVRLSAEGLGS